MKESVFNTLRTQEQLGYIVAQNLQGIRRMNHVMIKIVSKVAGPDKLESRVNAYLKERKEKWDPTDDELKAVIESLVNSLQQQDTALSGECSRHWEQIQVDHLTFDYRERRIEAV